MNMLSEQDDYINHKDTIDSSYEYQYQYQTESYDFNPYQSASQES